LTRYLEYGISYYNNNTGGKAKRSEARAECYWCMKWYIDITTYTTYTIYTTDNSTSKHTEKQEMANYSGLFNHIHGEDYSLNSGRAPNRYHLMRILRKRGMANVREVLTTALEDSTPASTASVSYSRVAAAANTSSNVQGGARTIETKQEFGPTLNNTDIDATGANTSRAITAADITELQEDLALTGDRNKRNPTNGSGVVTYPVDLSGNGGGGKGASKA